MEVIFQSNIYLNPFFSFIIDRTNVVNLGFEDSTITADEVSYENHEAEENETNRYIELLK